MRRNLLHIYLALAKKDFTRQRVEEIRHFLGQIYPALYRFLVATSYAVVQNMISKIKVLATLHFRTHPAINRNLANGIYSPVYVNAIRDVTVAFPKVYTASSGMRLKETSLSKSAWTELC